MSSGPEAEVEAESFPRGCMGGLAGSRTRTGVVCHMEWHGIDLALKPIDGARPPPPGANRPRTAPRVGMRGTAEIAMPFD